VSVVPPEQTWTPDGTVARLGQRGVLLSRHAAARYRERLPRKRPAIRVAWCCGAEVTPEPFVSEQTSNPLRVRVFSPSADYAVVFLVTRHGQGEVIRTVTAGEMWTGRARAVVERVGPHGPEVQR